MGAKYPSPTLVCLLLPPLPGLETEEGELLIVVHYYIRISVNLD